MTELLRILESHSSSLFRNPDGSLPPVAAGAYDAVAGQSAGGLSGATPANWHPKVQAALTEAYNAWVLAGSNGTAPGNCAEWRAINQLALQLGDKFSFGKHIKVQAIGTGTWNERFPLLQSVQACKTCLNHLSSLVDLLPGIGR